MSKLNNFTLIKLVFILVLFLKAYNLYGQLLNNPTDISGIQLWLDANDPNGNGTTPPDGTTINVWQDKSGVNNDAVVLGGQGPASFRSLPTLQINGNAVMEFTSVNITLGDVYNVSGLDIRPVTNPDVTIFVVYRQKNTTNTNNALWGIDNLNWDRFFYIRHSNFGDGVNDGIVGLGPGDQGAVVSGAAIPNKTHLLSVVYDGNVTGGINNGPVNASVVRFGGTIVANFTDTTDAIDQETSFRIGNDGDDGAGDFYLAEFIVYNRLLNECETSRVVDYLSIRYGEAFSQVIASQPQDAIICNPNDAIFNVSTKGAGLTYQWQEDLGTGVFNDIVDGGIYTGSNTNTLILTEPPVAHSGRQYRVMVTQPSGCVSISNPASLNIGPTDMLTSSNTTQFFCDIDDATIADIVITGTDIKWYTSPIGGTELSIADSLSHNTTYYATQTINGCESTPRLPILINVYETVVPLSLIDLSALNLKNCDTPIDGDDTNGYTEFDLTQNESTLLNGKLATDFTFRYFTDAAYTNEILTDPTVFVNTVQNLQQIYVRIENALEGSCNTETSFKIEVLSLPTANSPRSYVQCDDQSNDGQASFNLTLDSIKEEINANYISEGITFSYFEDQMDAETNSNAIANPDNYTDSPGFVLETVWVRVENPNGCFKVVPLALEVNPSSAALGLYKPQSIYQCDDGNNFRDGVATFNLTNIQDYISNVIFSTINVTIHFYESLVDAELENNEIADITNHQNTISPNSQDIWIRVKSDLDNSCLGLEYFSNLLIVEAVPVANPITLERQCDYNTADNVITYPFDTSQIESNVLNGQSLTDVSVTYTYLDTDGVTTVVSNTLPNPFLTASQIITIRVTNNVTLNPNEPCYDETELEFIVDEQPIIANIVSPQIVCDDGNDITQENDGLHAFDTSLFSNMILGSQSNMVFFYDYIDENGNQVTDANSLPNVMVSGNQTIIVDVVNPININCIASTTIDLIVNPLPEFFIEEEEIVCTSNPTFTINLEPLQTSPLDVFDYQWVYEDGTLLSNTARISVSTPGNYSLTLTNPITNCSKTSVVSVKASELANITPNDIIVEDISDSNTLTIVNLENLGSGNYQFSLESKERDVIFPFQESPVFNNVRAGVYTLFVREDICGTVKIDVFLLGYRKFFTPNGDGENDFWQIKGINPTINTSSDIYIFNRYGKLLKQLHPLSIGWDGTFNGSKLPEDDYWFKVLLQDGRLFKGHFTLKR